jgi:hypothetical protein
MNRLMAALLTTALASGPASAAAPAQAPEGGELSVTVTYNGKGEVKKGNEIGVFLWTTPDIGQSPPFAVQLIEKNGGTAVFKNLTDPVVYIGVTYDDKGLYDETAGPPPPGTPVAVYMDKKPETPTQGPPTPSPVKPGKGAKVHVKFDDSNRRR